MELLFAFLAGAALALLAGFLLRARAVAAQAEAHRAELATLTEENQAEKDALAASHAEALAAVEAKLTEEREAGIRLQAEVEKIHAVATKADEAAAEKAKWLELQKEEMEKTFQALSSRVLETSNKSFLERATERMKPIGDQLQRLEKATQDLEKGRKEAYGSLKEQIGSLNKATESYRTQAQSLSEALRGSSQARGRIGEMVLRNIAEFAGMTRYCDFEEQGANADGRRPDMVVKVPDGGAIPVDAKFPLAAFDRAMATQDGKERAAHLLQHAKDLRIHVQEMAKRDYSQYTKGDTDFTVLFLPGDHLLAAAFEAMPQLQEEAFDKRILITTPVTLVALLRTVSLYWRQHQMAENAQEIATEAHELMSRLGVFMKHFSKVGKNLGTAVGAFNDAVGSYERRILPTGRKVAELQHQQDDLPEVDSIDRDVRALRPPELDGPPVEKELEFE
jgi:DNA recombination protein RmuC